MCMFRIVISNSKRLYKTQKCILLFAISQTKFSTKKLPNIRNNFAFKNKFQNFVAESERNNVASSDLLQVESQNISPKTKKIKSFSPLQYRGELLYGIHPVYLSLLKRKRKIFQLFLKSDPEESTNNGKTSAKKEIERMAQKLGIQVRIIDSKGMRYLAPGVVHQGVCLDAEHLPVLDWEETEIEKENFSNLPLWLVLDEILDPMNVGAIIRSAHYFGVEKIFTVRGNSCKLSPTVSKASSGALEVMDIHQIAKLEDFLQVRKSQGWNIISTVAYCENQSEIHTPVIDVADMKVSKPTVLILGNEGRGVSIEIQKLCNGFVSIYPAQNLHQGIDSLNVSVAAGVILHSLSTKKVSR